MGRSGLVAWSSFDGKVGFRSTSRMVGSGFVPFRNGNSFLCDFVDGSLSDSKLCFLLQGY